MRKLSKHINSYSWPVPTMRIRTKPIWTLSRPPRKVLQPTLLHLQNRIINEGVPSWGYPHTSWWRGHASWRYPRSSWSKETNQPTTPNQSKPINYIFNYNDPTNHSPPTISLTINQPLTIHYSLLTICIYYIIFHLLVHLFDQVLVHL